jgi:hypothetical protein
MLMLCLGFPACCDEILWKDGRSEKTVLVRMENAQLVDDREGGESIRFAWEEVDKIAYSFPPAEGDFAERMESLTLRIAEILKEFPRGGIPESTLDNILRLAWEAGVSPENSLSQGDRKAFLEDLPPEKILESAEQVRQFLRRMAPESKSECYRAMQSGLVQALLGCRMMEGQLPERFERGFAWAEEGLFRLGAIFENCPDPDRDWNLIFMMNRLYKQWARFTPAYPEASIAWYGEQLSKAGQPNPLDASLPFPESFFRIAEAYIAQCHLWMAGDIASERKELLRQRQEFLAEGWVRAQKPGILRDEFFGQNRVLERWKRIQALADIVYLTAESSLFKQTRQRLDPQKQTNMPPLRDPFGGRYYRYLSGEKFDRIYSIGPDRKDQSGKVAYFPDSATREGDIYLLQTEE